jgi:ribosomal protein S18 acetylase RimI-like enzyme
MDSTNRIVRTEPPVWKELTYRPAKGKADAEAVDHIYCASSDEITSRLGEGHWTRGSDVASVLEEMRKRDTFLVFSENTTGGYSAAAASFTVGGSTPRFWPPSIWRVPDTAEQAVLGVFGLAVLPPFQRQGIGTWIMRQIETIARERGCRFVRLDAYEQNPRSVAFYRRMGYDERGRLVVSGIPLICFEQEVTVE